MVGTEEVDGAKLIQASRYFKRENIPPFKEKCLDNGFIFLFGFNCKHSVLSGIYQIACYSLTLYTVVEVTCLT